MTSQAKRICTAVWVVLALIYGMWACQSAKAQPAATDHATIIRSAAEAEEQPGKALYLNALASFHDKDYERTVHLADDLIAEHKDSAWVRKAGFLKARALVQQREFEAAEAIYEAEAHRLLSEERKQEIAGVFIEFADALAAKPDPNDVGALPPDYGKAASLYTRALGLEIGRKLRDKIMYKRARVTQLANRHGQAVGYYREYLREFDPNWTGNVGSATRMAGTKRENPLPAGQHVLEARLHLSEAQLESGDPNRARVNLADLATLIASKETGEAPDEAFTARARWLLVRTYPLPQPPEQVLERSVGAVRAFLEVVPSDPHAVIAAFWIAQSYQHAGRLDQAAEAYEAFIAGEGYALPASEKATETLERFDKSPAQLQDEWLKEAAYRIGHIRFQQKQYAEAAKAWQDYINRYPDGPRWSDCQRGIVNTEFQVAVDAVTKKEYEAARKLFETFLAKRPLDGRAARALFVLGQIEYSRAQKLEEEKASEDAINAAHREAVAQWNRLVSKYPRTAESSLALYRIGMIYEEKLTDLESALDAYRRLDWGDWAAQARARIAAMTGKHLELRTERKFRTNEPAKVKLNVRNIDKLTFKQYTLDLEAYFRKTHGTGEVEELDIDLIQPDKTWEVEIEGYEKYAPKEQEVEVAFADGKPGVCLINVSEEDLEATTLVIRSDLDLIAKSSRREALVFVQDMLDNRPASDVDLLLSDGESVFATGKTGNDGVFRGKFDDLKNMEEVSVFAIHNGHIASNGLNLEGLGFSEGLSAKGYLYTDRPAYQPGWAVKLRGIIRDVKDGSYVATQDDVYLVSITDTNNRLVWEQEQRLSEFGTFHSEMTLDARAPLGAYTLTARRKEAPGTAYSATFRVERFALEKMQLVLETDRQFYFRGEEVTLNIKAQYYWGQPITGRPIRYVLPDGRYFIEDSDDEGKLVVKYDTTGLTPGRAMQFRASIDGEGVQASHVAMLALQGFNISVKPGRKLALAGEPLDVEITTTTPEGKPVGQSLNLFVLRRETPKPDTVLGEVPWVHATEEPSGEVTVEERKVVTDDETGKATVNLKLDKGGRYILRVSGEDRFKQVITAAGTVDISDEEDATRLRLFADTDTLQVGGEAKVRLHSRLDRTLALLTYEGEEIISHEVITLAGGYNDIDIPVGHEHFPNFQLAVAAMDDRTLRTAAKPFRVERQLRVEVIPLEEAYEPGAPGKVELTVTDQLGMPVQAELSLALIDEALFALYRDTTPPILDFFQKDARRHAEFRATSTCSFEYLAATREVIKAYQEEAERLLRVEKEAQALADVNRRARGMRRGGSVASRALKRMEAKDELGATGEVIQTPEGVGMVVSRDALSIGYLRTDGEPLAGGRVAEQPRKELPGAGYWIGSVVTDDKGKAVIEVPMPENTTQWRLTSRGCSVETLVGEATANVMTRKDFFVALKAPQQIQEGDTVRILSRIHNMTDYAGPVDLVLTVLGGDDLDDKRYERKQRIEIKADGEAEALFEGFETPLAAALKFQVTAKAGEYTDALVATIPVRPWGLEFADHCGGVSDGDATVFLELPADHRYASQWMTVSIGPDLKRAVIDMALRNSLLPRPLETSGSRIIPPPPGCDGFPGSDLLAIASALEYAGKVSAPRPDVQRLQKRARALVGALVTSQRGDGGWTWTGVQKTSDWTVTAMSFWALCESRNQGVAVHADTLAKAETYLKNRFMNVHASDNDAKAVILHALSANSAADFAHANRLHRERNSLSELALAYTALSLTNMERSELAGELLDVLDSKALPQREGERTLRYWKPSNSYGWLNDPRETTAVAVLAMMRVRPASPRVKEAVDYLMSQRGAFGFIPAKAHGPAVSALAEHFGLGKFGAADYRLTLLVNGKEIRTIAATRAPVRLDVPIPREHLVNGKNQVAFRMKGRGEYAYSVTLRGFSSDLRDPRSWPDDPYPRSRRYYHATLEYRGRPISARSTSPVRNVAIGQRVRVHVDFDNDSMSTYLSVEEPIPAGMAFVEGSLSGNFTDYEVHAGKLIMYFAPWTGVSDIDYELVGYSTGTYRVLPTVLRDMLHPSRMRVGPKSELTVLAPGEAAKDPYQMNTSERYALGTLYFNDGLYEQALPYLSHIFKNSRTYNEREVARMLLWIYTSEGFYDARQIVETFEALRERHPQLQIPFDKILVAGRAYRDLGEFERAYLIFKATMDASFISDSNVSAVLEDEGQFLGSIKYQEDLWYEYPDTAQVAAAYFALSQALYQKAPMAAELAKVERKIALARGEDPENLTAPNKVKMLEDTIRLLSEFLALYPDSPLADDAAFSMANAYLDLKLYDRVVEACEEYMKRFPESELAGSFEYMAALGHFWQHHYRDAIRAAKSVADSESKDRDYARYIVGQIYHAEGEPADAIEWYRKVAELYPDAKQAIEYFERKHIELDEVSVFRPGEKVELKLKYRNIKEAAFQVYKVDLMKLYLREKNLTNITEVNLAGIKPIADRTLELGDGKDYVDKEEGTRLDLEEEGAYLVICRGDNLFASGMVLITPLKIEVQEDATSGRVRANVIDTVDDKYMPEVHVKVIGSADAEFRSGETDLRGIFVADNINGEATVIARDGDSRYAFYRGTRFLGALDITNIDAFHAPLRAAQKLNYQSNVWSVNAVVQDSNVKQFDQMRRQVNQGVEMQAAY